MAEEKEVLIGSIIKRHTYSESKETFEHNFPSNNCRKRASQYIYGRTPESEIVEPIKL